MAGPSDSLRGRLLVCSGPNTGATIPLDQAEVTLGRGSECDVIINDGRASATHARIEVSDGQHVISDLGSTNGTFVNNRRIQAVRLRTGELVQIGETIFEYTEDTDAAEARPASGASGASTALAFPSSYGEAASAQAPREQIGGASARYHLPPGPEAAVPYTHPSEDAAIDFVALAKRLVKIGKMYARHWPIFVLALLLGAVGGLLRHQIFPPAKKAVFTINLVPTANDALADGFNRRERASFFGAAETNFRRKGLIEKTLKDLGITPSDAYVDIIHNVLLQFYKSGGYNSDLYSGSFLGDDGPFAVRFLEQHLENYLEDEMKKALSRVEGEEKFFREELRKAKAELESARKALEDFKASNLDALPDQAADVYQRLSSLRIQRRAVERRIGEEQIELARERRSLASLPAYVDQSIAVANPFAEQVASTRKQLAAAEAAGKGPRHPDVIRLRDELARAQALADDPANSATGINTTKARNPAYVSAEAKVRALESSLAVARRQLTDIDADIEKASASASDLPELETSLEELEARYANAKSEKTKLTEKLQLAERQVALERSNAASRYDLIAEPQLEFVNEKARTRKAAILGMGVGFLLGFVVVTVLIIRKGWVTLEMLTHIPRVRTTRPY